MKQLAIVSILGVIAVCGLAQLQNPAVTVQGYHINGPATPADFPRWIADMKVWRTDYLKGLKYDDSEYKRPELLWTQSSFMQPQMMVEDRYFYDPATDDRPRIDTLTIWRSATAGSMLC